MSDNPEIQSGLVPALPDLEKLRQAVVIANAQGQEMSIAAYDSVFDMIPERTGFLPLLKAGQVEDKNLVEKQGKNIVYPLSKTLYLQTIEYDETENSSKPEAVKKYQVLPDTSIILIPVAVDATRMYWKADYNAENIVDPDCQSRAAMVRPMPDEMYIERDNNNRILRGKISHACMVPNEKGQLVDFCPMAKWGANKARPACIFYIHIYGLIQVGSEWKLVETRYKRASFKSGQEAMNNIRKAVAMNNYPFSVPIKLTHGIANEEIGGYTYYALTNKTPLPTDSLPTLEQCAEAAEQANAIITANRARADLRNPVSGDQPVDGIIVEESEKTPF